MATVLGNSCFNPTTRHSCRREVAHSAAGHAPAGRWLPPTQRAGAPPLPPGCAAAACGCHLARPLAAPVLHSSSGQVGVLRGGALRRPEPVGARCPAPAPAHRAEAVADRLDASPSRPSHAALQKASGGRRGARFPACSRCKLILAARRCSCMSSPGRRLRGSRRRCAC